MASMLTGPQFAPAGGRRPRQLVVLLHGSGGNGASMLSLAPLMANHLPEALFIAPDAPELLPNSDTGRWWFPFADFDPDLWRGTSANAASRLAALTAGVYGAGPALDQFIDRALKQHDIAPSQLALVGLSQGGMLALHIGLRRRVAPAAVVSFAGALLGAERLAEEVIAPPPMLLLHGTADDVIAIDALLTALNQLAGANIPAEFHISHGLNHGVDAEGVALAATFLANGFRRRQVTG